MMGMFSDITIRTTTTTTTRKKRPHKNTRIQTMKVFCRTVQHREMSFLHHTYLKKKTLDCLSIRNKCTEFSCFRQTVTTVSRFASKDLWVHKYLCVNNEYTNSKDECRCTETIPHNFWRSLTQLVFPGDVLQNRVALCDFHISVNIIWQL